MVTLRIAKASLTSPSTKLRIANASLQGTGTTPKLRIANASLTGSTPATLRAIADQTVEAFATVTLQVLPGATSPTPTSYHWRQISGPAVSFTDGGDTITFTAPPGWAGATVVFGVVGYLGTQTTAEATATVNSIPHLYWALDNTGTWQPRRIPVTL